MALPPNAALSSTPVSARSVTVEPFLWPVPVNEADALARRCRVEVRARTEVRR